MTEATADRLTMESLRGWMRGNDCVVVGCGPSAQIALGFEPFGTRWLIACNRSVQWCDPEFVLCVEPWRDRHWAIIRDHSSPFVLFTRIGHNNRTREPVHPRQVQIGSRARVDSWLDPTCGIELRLAQSPYYAAAVATHLGFETVGLIGVDLDDERRWPEAGLARAEKQWGLLARVCNDLGTRIINLNPKSRLTSVPFGDWSEVRTKHG